MTWQKKKKKKKNVTPLLPIGICIGSLQQKTKIKEKRHLNLKQSNNQLLEQGKKIKFIVSFKRLK